MPDRSPDAVPPTATIRRAYYGGVAEIRGDLSRANKPLTDGMRPNASTRRHRHAPTSWNAEAMTVDVVAATTAPVQRSDRRGSYVEILDMATLDLSEVEGIPCRDDHLPGGTRTVVGVVQSAHVEGDELHATLRLTTAEDAAPVVQRVADGTVSGISIGYAVRGWAETTEAGQRVRRPTSWRLTEVSISPNPADRASRVRSLTPPGAAARPGRIPDNRAALEGPMPDDNPPVVDTTPDAEQTRRSDIRSLARSRGATPEQADAWIDAGASPDDVRLALFDQPVRRSHPVIRAAAPRNDDPRVLVRRRTDALVTRMTGADLPPDAREFMGDSMMDMARSCLAASGTSTRGLSHDEILQRSAHGTSDFPLVVSNAVNKVALDAYEAAESMLKKICRSRRLPNFKPSTSIRAGGMGRLEELEEHGEITHTTRAESGEVLTLTTFARAMNVSRKLMIDDDLGLLSDMTQAFGTAAAQTEADVLVNVLTGAAPMSDGIAPLDVRRGNVAAFPVSLGSAGGGVSAIGDGRQAMRRVKDLDGRTIVGVPPRYLVVGPDSETAAEQLLVELSPGTVAEVNPFSSRLSLIVEPRIEGDGWWLFADPARMP